MGSARVPHGREGWLTKTLAVAFMLLIALCVFVAIQTSRPK